MSGATQRAEATLPGRSAAFRTGLRRLPALFVGVVLVATGVGKALDLEGFVGVLAGYRLMPAWGDRLVAYTLPFVELATGLGLLSGLARRPAAAAAVGLHALLVGVVVVTLWRGVPVENCGCFGVFLARPLSVQTLLEDLAMLALSLWALAGVRPRRAA